MVKDTPAPVSLSVGPWAPCKTTHVLLVTCRMCANCKRPSPRPLWFAGKTPDT